MGEDFAFKNALNCYSNNGFYACQWNIVVMDKMNQKMKKLVNLKGVLDGLRTSASTPPKGSEIEVEERLRSEHFQVTKVIDYTHFNKVFDFPISEENGLETVT